LTQNALATPIRTPVGHVTAHMPNAYIKDNNIYFQSSEGQPVQLTSSGKDRDPILSDDGQKIAFYRGEANDNINYINSDSGQEYGFIVSETPLLTGKGEIVSPTFVPGTHMLLFNTYLCGPRLGLYDGADCTAGVFSIDTDLGKVETVVNNLSGSSWRDRNFEISPNGKYVSVAGSGHIDIYAASSSHFKLAYPNVINYYITTPDEYLPAQYWLPNSSGLIAILAADGEYNDPADPPSQYTAYRYTIKDKQGVQLLLDKFMIRGDGWSISPNRNWMLFTGNDSGYYAWQDEALNYLVNLNDSHTQAYEGIGWPLSNCQWSPDSKHFVSSTNTFAGFIGSVDGSTPIPVGGSFLEWIDNTHYYYAVWENTIDTTRYYIGEIPSK
jgi:Tol biopolymer transport system component